MPPPPRDLPRSPTHGGVARSVTSFTDEYRRRCHQVTVVAPVFPGMPEHEEDVIRVRALQTYESVLDAAAQAQPADRAMGAASKAVLGQIEAK